VDEATQKSMIAWYHKKQEEQKALDENQDDTYMHASWASGNSLKAHFSGVSEVRLPY
jgi:cilia- and flagella-associated protein 298